MKQPQQGDIYLLNWDPSVGHEFQKSRPAIVISSDQTLRKSNLVTVMAMTSSGKALPEDIPITKDNQNRLMKNSTIKVHHISSFDPKRLLHYIGSANKTVITKIKNYLNLHFGLT